MIQNNFDKDMDGFIDFCKEVVESHPNIEREVQDQFEIAMQNIEKGRVPYVEISRARTAIKRIIKWSNEKY